MISGNYVPNFNDASHGLVAGISLDAKWRYVFLKIAWVKGNHVKFEEYPEPCAIHNDRKGKNYALIQNECPLGRIYNRKPSTHKVFAFKDRGREGT